MGDANDLRWIRGWYDGEAPALEVPLHLCVLNLGQCPFCHFFLLYFFTSAVLNLSIHNVVF